MSGEVMIALFMDVQPVWKSTDIDQDTIEEGEMMYGEEAFPVTLFHYVGCELCICCCGSGLLV